MKNTFKRILSSLMVVAMLLTAAPLSGIAELDLQSIFGVSASAVAYSGTYGENITWSFNKETGELVISGTGEMPDLEDVLDTDDYYKYYMAVLPYIVMMGEVTKLTINEGITKIRDYAFSGMKSLKSISIPDSVVSIGIGAFDDTAYYYDASNWDNGVLYIDDCLIAGSGVTGKYIVRENTRVIADYALYYCYDLTGIVLNDGIVSVGNYALPTHELDGLTIPDGIIYIGDYAFLGMDNVTDLIIPDSVKTIGSCAFESDYNTVHIGKGVENIDPQFLANSNFTDIIVDPENKYLSIDENNILFNKDKTELIGALDRYCVEVYKIPDTVTKIADRAFDSCYGLKEVIFGDNVQIIGEYAFASCVYLESVTFADRLTTIGERAFRDCRRLKSLTIPGSVRTIGQYAFCGCYDVESLTIHEGVTYIGDYAFESIDDITELVIPESVTYIGDHAFGGVDGITDLVIPDSVTYLGDCNFNYSDKLENIEIGDGIEYIGCNVFDGTPYFSESSNWDSDVLYIGQYLIKAKSDLVGSCTIKDGTKIIADEAFYGCHDLTTVEIPDSVKSIGYRAFSDCTSLTDIKIPDSVETIGDEAFVACGFTTLEIPDGVKTIGEYAFAGCMELTDISIPASVIDIGVAAFTYSWKLRNITVDPENENYVTDEYGVLYSKDKSELCVYPAASTATEYVIPDTVTLIGEAAFIGASNLNKVEIPNSVIMICREAFEGSGLTSVFIPGSVRIVGRYAFVDCDNLTEAVLEEGIFFVDYSGMNMFAGCDNLKTVKLPSSLNYINEEMFRNCRSLESIEIGNGIELINWGAFEDCESLTDVYYYGTEEEWNEIEIAPYNEPLLNANIHFLGHQGFTYELDENNNAIITGYNGDVPSELVIPSKIDGYNVIAIGESAFENSTNIIRVTIPDSVTSIGDDAFSGCENLTEFPKAKNVVSIGVRAFAGCKSLVDVTIPDGVESIGMYAFMMCTALEKVSIPASVKEIGYAPFTTCVKLERIIVDEANTNYSAKDNVLYNKDQTVLIQCSYGAMDLQYIISDTVNIVEASAFFMFPVEKITLPNVTHINEAAFANCNNLSEVTFSNSMEFIGKNAFADCDITDVYYYGTEEEWNEIEILDGNEPLLNANIHFLEDGYDLTYELDENNNAIITGYIGELPAELVIPSTIDGYTVVEIGYEAFNGCDNITNVTIADSVKTIGIRAFNECEKLISVTIPDGVEVIDSMAFACCYCLEKAELPDSIKQIGYGAFGECYVLKDITLSNNIEYIGDYAFYMCMELTQAIIPEKITYIGEGTFCLCTGLETVTIGDKVQSIGDLAFAGCYSLTDLTIGNSVETIGYVAFAENVKLTSVTIPDSVTYIDSAFENCTALEIVNMGNGVELIVKSAFEGCESLTDVYYNGTEAEWNEIEIVEEGNEPLLNANIHFLGDHNWDTVTVPSTCKVQGVSYDICLDCGDIQNYTVLPFAEHTWSEWTVVTEATTEHDGLKSRTCSVCGETEEEIIPKLNKLVDDKSGVEIIYEDEYDQGIEIVVTDVYDGNSFNLIDKHFGSSKSMIFDITTVKDGQKVQPSGKVKVRIPLPDGYGTKGVYIVYLDPTSGKVEKLNATIVDGYIEFVTDHFSYYAVVEKLGKVNSVAIDNISMNYKDSATVTPTISVDAGVKYTVSYSSSDNGVATVDANGKVTATGKGSATITVTVTDQYGNTVTDTCKVDVKYTWWQWIIVIVLFGWIWY